MDELTKANNFESTARNCQNQFNWFGLTTNTNILAARDAYSNAAMAYKRCKHYQNAAKCYQEAAKCAQELQDTIETKYCWLEAAKLYARSNDISSSMHAYKMAIEINLKSNRFYHAAKLQCQMADILIEARMFEKAIDCYQNAVTWYKTEQDIRFV